MSDGAVAVAPSERAPDYARRGEDLFLRGDTEGALALLTSGLRHAADDAAPQTAARLVLARMAREAGLEGEEIEWLESALRADPECPSALLRLSELPAAHGRGIHREKLDAQEPWRSGEREAFVRGPALFASSSSASAAVAPGPLAADASAPPTVPPPIPKTLSTRRAAPLSVPSFTFPVREEEEDAENDENTAPHVATVTLAEIYFQQGLKEQAAQIYRQLLERQPGDAAVKRRLDEIEASIVAPD